MSAPDALVHTELDGVTYLVGHLWIRESRRGTFGATFQYADAWLEKKDAFAIDPLLPLVSPGPFHKERLFGAIADSAPDRWGKTLMARAERLRARREDRAPRHLREIDYVLGVSDVARQGALRSAPGFYAVVLERRQQDALRRFDPGAGRWPGDVPRPRRPGC